MNPNFFFSESSLAMGGAFILTIVVTRIFLPSVINVLSSRLELILDLMKTFTKRTSNALSLKTIGRKIIIAVLITIFTYIIKQSNVVEFFFSLFKIEDKEIDEEYKVCCSLAIVAALRALVRVILNIFFEYPDIYAKMGGDPQGGASTGGSGSSGSGNSGSGSGSGSGNNLGGSSGGQGSSDDDQNSDSNKNNQGKGKVEETRELSEKAKGKRPMTRAQALQELQEETIAKKKVSEINDMSNDQLQEEIRELTSIIAEIGPNHPDYSALRNKTEDCLNLQEARLSGRLDKFKHSDLY